LPINNVVYVEIMEGDDFGQADIIGCALENDQDIEAVLKVTELLVRQFTVQALVDCELFTLNISCLGRMRQEFIEAFLQIFNRGEERLRRIMQQKLRAIKRG